MGEERSMLNGIRLRWLGHVIKQHSQYCCRTENFKKKTTLTPKIDILTDVVVVLNETSLKKYIDLKNRVFCGSILCWGQSLAVTWWWTYTHTSFNLTDDAKKWIMNLNVDLSSIDNIMKLEEEEEEFTAYKS